MTPWGGMPSRLDPRSRESRSDADGERSDYLVEDEESWQKSNRCIVPPAID